jgi:hypothetical protein
MMLGICKSYEFHHPGNLPEWRYIYNSWPVWLAYSSHKPWIFSLIILAIIFIAEMVPQAMDC